jgi:hypothetical protein
MPLCSSQVGARLCIRVMLADEVVVYPRDYVNVMTRAGRVLLYNAVLFRTEMHLVGDERFGVVLGVGVTDTDSAERLTGTRLPTPAAVRALLFERNGDSCQARVERGLTYQKLRMANRNARPSHTVHRGMASRADFGPRSELDCAGHTFDKQL